MSDLAGDVDATRIPQMRLQQCSRRHLQQLPVIVRRTTVKSKSNLRAVAVRDIQAFLDKMLKPIVDANARREWDWSPRYELEEMVDDFLLELRDNPQRYASSA